MTTLLNSTASTATSASRFADEARASTARAQSAKAEMSGQFSQLLRGYDKPADSPKPAAEASPVAAPPKAEGRTETQRQEARGAAPKKSAEPAAKNAAEQPATAAAAQPAAQAGEAAAKTALETKSADDAAAPKDDAASPASAIAALLTPPTPLALPMGAVGTPGSAKPHDSEIAPDDAAKPDDGKASAKIATSVPMGRAAHAATAADDVRIKAGDAASNPTNNSSAADFATALADAAQVQPALIHNTEAGPRAHRDGATTLEGIAGAQAPQNTLNAGPADTSSPAARVTIASPLYTPGFAPEMAARLSVLAADGVQTAQLHLNPADMGPVVVQIVVDGQQARIEFQADQADTRAVLERSLPDLAAALRDSGLTLSGGGVFQQFAGQDQSGAQARSDGSSAPRRGSSRDVSDSLATLPARVAAGARPTQGVVDLYA